MSGVILPTPEYKAEDWQGFITQVSKQRIGFMSLSLTNYDNNSEPQIAIASVVEINQSLFRFMEDTPIIGTPSSGVMNYIVLIPSGSGEDQIASPNWTTVAPYWKDTRQGWYSSGGTQRYVARCWYDGTYYTQKRVLGGWRRKVREDHVDDDGTINTVKSSCDLEEVVTKYWSLGTDVGGSVCCYMNISAGGGLYFPIHLPHGAVVTGLYCYWTASLTVRTVDLERSEVDSTSVDSTMATATAGNNVANGSDTSISDPTIDNQNYKYYLYAHHNGGGGQVLRGVVISYTVDKVHMS
jgi:hypothetical protein